MTVGILNEYMSTLGGGERSTLAYAVAMRDIFEEPVVLHTLAPVASVKDLQRAFGYSLEGITVAEEEDTAALESAIRGARYRWFINHSFCSSFPNPAPFGTYSMMFPSGGEGTHLGTYDFVLCNSYFTAKHAALSYPRWKDRIRTVYPPIRRSTVPRSQTKNWSRAVNIGRYGYNGHNKNQLLLAKIMRDTNSRLPEEPFEITFCGRITELSYFDACLSEATAETSFLVDVSEGEIQEILEKAGLYIHATGLDVPEGRYPERCEHFGLAILEAMSHGCVPLAYARGGPVEFISHGVDGFLYESAEELREQLVFLRSLPITVREQLSRNARVTASTYSYERFLESFRSLISALSHTPHVHTRMPRISA